MSKSLSKIEELASRLIQFERSKIVNINDDFGPIIAVFESIRHSISKVSGSGGYHSLLRRALDMAKVKAPSLEMIRIGEKSVLEMNDGISTDYKQLTNEKAGLVLLTQFLGLLALFIGESMAFSLVEESWTSSTSERVIAIVKDKP